ncbi:MAG TPA: TetR/AcrR family transcriptional regulator [Acidimicrobiales bacterium]|nr:TetR/AcrR family transcriptional regulator [Acidimicrobiales bacterium]
MTTNGPGDDAAAVESTVTWREQAVARSLSSARTRAEIRVQRFLDAALEIMGEGDTTEFTVQEVVERSGQSLRSFYQYFGGKHELLLALFEESIRATADRLRDEVATEDDPQERLHRFVVEYYRMCRPARKARAATSAPAPVMVEFAQRLLTAHPAEAARAFVPLVALFREILAAAVATGAVRAGLREEPVAGTVLQMIMFNAFASTISGTRVARDGAAAAEELWELVLHGLGPDAAP